MSDQPNPKDSDDRGSRIAVAVFSVVLGLCPGFIISSSLQNGWHVPTSTILFCAILSVGGGIGCLVGVKNHVARFVGGFFLGLLLLFVSTGIGYGLACAQGLANM